MFGPREPKRRWRRCVVDWFRPQTPRWRVRFLTQRWVGVEVQTPWIVITARLLRLIIVAFHTLTTVRHRKDADALSSYRDDIRRVITESDLSEPVVDIPIKIEESANAHHFDEGHCRAKVRR